MNYKKELNKYQELLNEVGIQIEDKEYLQDEIERDLNKIVNYVMSSSSKNGGITNKFAKFDAVISAMNYNIKK